MSLSEQVRASLLLPELCHREEEYREIHDEVRRSLTLVYGADSPLASDFEAVLLTGSGTTALEAMLGSLVPASAGVLAVANGAYGERIARICAALGIRHHLLDLGWESPVDPVAVAVLLRGGSFDHVAVVHHETTTGRLNALGEIDALCADAGATLLVDAVSSFGAERLAFASVGAFAVSSNKCLHGIPGAAIVLARRDLLEAAASRAPRSVALHLPAYRAEWPPFTPPVQTVVALRAALRELGAGGAESRRTAYAALSGRLRDAAVAAGYALLLPREAYASSLTSFPLPAGLDYGELHTRLRRLGYVIYAGQGALERRIFRIANMGALRDEDLDGLVLGLRDAIGSREHASTVA